MQRDIINKFKRTIRKKLKDNLIAEGHTGREAKNLTNKLEIRHQIEDEAYEEYEELVAWMINEFENRSGTN